MNRYQFRLLIVISVAMVLSWIRAPFPREMYLQHIPTVAVLIASPLLARRFPLNWGLSMTLAPHDAEAYNGQQGDIWDAQKDMLAALVGGLCALSVSAVTRRSRAVAGEGS